MIRTAFVTVVVLRGPMLRMLVAIVATLTSLAASAMNVKADAGEPATPAPERIDSEGRTITGTVLTTADASGHTYVQLETVDGIVWATVPRTEIRKGDLVYLPNAYPMVKFYSPSLERRFDVIYFAPSVQVRERGGAAVPDMEEDRAPYDPKASAPGRSRSGRPAKICA